MPPKRLTYQEALKNAIAEIALGGTKIVTFKYVGGYTYNVLLGAKCAVASKHCPKWLKKQINPILFVDTCGIECITGIVNPRHNTESFDIEFIRDFSYLRPDHFYHKKQPTLWRKVKWFLVRILSK